eukprot:223738_1
MPSFSVDNENYYYYYEHLTVNTELESKDICFKCLRYSIIIFIAFPLLLSWYFTIIYIYSNHPSFYHHYLIHWIPNILCALFCSLWIAIILFLLSNIHESSDTLHHIFEPTSIKSLHVINRIRSTKRNYALFITFLTVFILIPLAFFAISKNIYILSPCAPHCNAFQFVTFVLIPGLLPPISFAFWYCKFYIHRHYTNELKSSETGYDMNERLLSSAASPTSTIARQTKPIKKSAMFVIIHCIVMFWYFVEVRSWNESIVDPFVYYMQFLAFSTVFKWILKYYAHVIDRIRSLRNNEQYYVSMELLMEWYCSLLYYNWFKWFITWGINFEQLMCITVVHIGSEMIQFNLKISRKYSTVSTMAINWLFHHRFSNRCYWWLYALFRDSSDHKTWAHRISMDVMIRFYAAMIAGVCSIGTLLMFTIDNVYKEVFMRLCCSIGVDFVYFMVSVYVILWAQGVLVCEPMITYIASMKRRYCTILLIIYFIQYSFLLFLVM